jgi:hypothetical protein
MSDLGYERLMRPRCPHCGEDFHVWDGDNPLALSYEDGGRTEFICDECNEVFTCVTTHRYVFSTAINEDAADDEQWGPQRVVDRTSADKE